MQCVPTLSSIDPIVPTCLINYTSTTINSSTHRPIHVS